jgi:transcriptional regulator with XRE-family HTH domain
MNLEARTKLSQVVRRTRGKETLTMFARKINVTYGAVAKWENLESIPSTENLEKIGNLAGYSLEEFLEYLEGKKPQPTKIDALLKEIRSMEFKQLAILDRAVAERFCAIAESVG